MHKIVAVSGGVDSVVLLDMLAKEKSPHVDYVVAHFDHGIRSDSASDTLFVEQLAKQYGFLFETRREELGSTASEEQARTRRYAFLRAVAKRYQATIITAHHADDVVETIAINLARGTGWRGLAVLDSEGIERPLLGLRKKDILHYAAENRLSWREDSTNNSDAYLRNRIRKKTLHLSDDIVNQILALRAHQIGNKSEIEQALREITPSTPYSRYFFTSVPENVAIEMLRAIFISQFGYSPHRKQLQVTLIAVKTLRPGKRFSVYKNIEVQLNKKDFTVETIKRVM